MSLFTEYIPENDRTGFAFEVVDLKLLRALDYFRIVSARLAQPSEIALHVGHEYRHTTRAEILCKRLQRDRLTRAGRACNQAVAIRHFWKQINWFLRLCDVNGFVRHNVHKYRCLSCSFAPGTQYESANRESNEWTAHVDENQRPRICLASREHGDRRVFDEEKCKPAHERDV